MLRQGQGVTAIPGQAAINRASVSQHMMTGVVGYTPAKAIPPPLPYLTMEMGMASSTMPVAPVAMATTLPDVVSGTMSP